MDTAQARTSKLRSHSAAQMSQPPGQQKAAPQRHRLREGMQEAAAGHTPASTEVACLPSEQQEPAGTQDSQRQLDGCQTSSPAQGMRVPHTQASGNAGDGPDQGQADEARQQDHASQQAAAEKHYAHGYSLRKAVRAAACSQYNVQRALSLSSSVVMCALCS